MTLKHLSHLTKDSTPALQDLTGRTRSVSPVQQVQLLLGTGAVALEEEFVALAGLTVELKDSWKQAQAEVLRRILVVTLLKKKRL